jgi:hypothetical protein
MQEVLSIFPVFMLDIFSLILIRFSSLISKHVSFIYIVWLLLPFYRILKLQFIVQNGFLLWVDLARETSGSGTIIYLWTVLQIIPVFFFFFK